MLLTNKPSNKQTNTTKDIISLAEVTSTLETVLNGLTLLRKPTGTKSFLYDQALSVVLD